MDARLKELSGTPRREFIKWSATVAALLGLERSRFLDVLAGTSGSALADEAACGKTSKSVHLIAGNGGLAWFTQLFPYVQIAKTASTTLSFYGTPTDVKDAATDNPSVYGKYSPFQTLPKSKQMTMFIAGVNQTHTNTPSTGLQLGTSGLIAAIASIQTANPTLLPVMAINPFVYGTAAGAPAVATVANSAGLVDLFNSSASKTILADPKNAGLSEAYYKAFLSLNAAAPRQTTARVYDTGKVAANLLGKNLSDQLAVQAADNTRYEHPRNRARAHHGGQSLQAGTDLFAHPPRDARRPARRVSEHDDAHEQRDGARQDLRRLHGRLPGDARSRLPKQESRR
jgi:hypothetical protein